MLRPNARILCVVAALVGLGAFATPAQAQVTTCSVTGQYAVTVSLFYPDGPYQLGGVVTFSPPATCAVNAVGTAVIDVLFTARGLGPVLLVSGHRAVLVRRRAPAPGERRHHPRGLVRHLRWRRQRPGGGGGGTAARVWPRVGRNHGATVGDWRAGTPGSGWTAGARGPGRSSRPNRSSGYRRRPRPSRHARTGWPDGTRRAGGRNRIRRAHRPDGGHWCPGVAGRSWAGWPGGGAGSCRTSRACWSDRSCGPRRTCGSHGRHGSHGRARGGRCHRSSRSLWPHRSARPRRPSGSGRAGGSTRAGRRPRVRAPGRVVRQPEPGRQHHVLLRVLPRRCGRKLRGSGRQLAVLCPTGGDGDRRGPPVLECRHARIGADLRRQLPAERNDQYPGRDGSAQQQRDNDPQCGLVGSGGGRRLFPDSVDDPGMDHQPDRCQAGSGRVHRVGRA